MKSILVRAFLLCFLSMHFLISCSYLPRPASNAKKDRNVLFEPKTESEINKTDKETISIPIKNDYYTLGYLEKVSIKNINDLIGDAKLDTGADTTSIDADIIKIIQRGNKEYILYRINLNSVEKTFEDEIVRWSRIKKKKEGNIKRPVIKITLCIDGKLITEEVNIADRQNFQYKILIGRNFLNSSNILVDSSKIFISKNECKN